MKKQTVYQLDSKGNTKQWSVQVDNVSNTGVITVEHGLKDGKLTVEKTIITVGKNPGKANETTPFTQAVKEAEAKIEQKLRKGYVADITQVRPAGILGSGIPKPLLAEKHDPTEKQSKSKNLKRIGIEGMLVGVQRKKDGNRCLIRVNQQGAFPSTREGDAFPTNGLEHILDSIHATFMKSYDFYNKKYGITEYILDGELYTNVVSFNKLNGIATKEDKTPADLIICAQIKYHLYDVMLPVGYETRYKIIQNFGSASVHVEECFFIVATDANIKQYLEMFLAEGEEGLMLRQLGMPYENKRSWQLCKVKLFEDDEFEIVGFEESAKGNMAGAVVLKAPAGCFDRNGDPIHTFKAGLKFSHEECREFWANPAKYAGKLATVEFFGKSEYGIPRFPKCRKLR